MKKKFKFIIRSLYRLLPTSLRIKIGYFRVYKKWPNTSHPKAFNEKVLARIIHDKNELYPMLADKYLVRDFIEKNIDSDVLIPLIAVTEKPSDLLEIQDWSNCVFKPNHGAGMVKIFDENPNFNLKKATVELADTWLKLDFSKVCDEWHYSKIKPLILVEKKITKDSEIPRDYKFHCFKQKNSSFKYVLQLVDGRFGEESRGYYNNSFEECSWHHGAGKHTLSNDEQRFLPTMLEFNQKILNVIDINYLRIDWYLVDGKIYFGELTVTPGAGRTNEFGGSLEEIMGSYWID
ncbi:ATP-grasp fold amidoligase family protein [Acinetobacter pseudolwoffii]|uniref:ATP-grasp fold amidoligase family protein n=1 Tax=Acinetobacter pseudolwoffii TaxID=2053287 RepID=UPI0021E3988A|nr:ATP-grasp fold amidoligase family protein [Acinetobacter pseudolwoffii]